MSDIDSDKWLEVIKSEMDSVDSNQVWTLVDPPKGVKPIGCKWVYKYKLGADGEVAVFKARLVANDTLNDLGTIYGLKQASRSWNTHFDEVIWGYDFIKIEYDPCVYKKISGSSIAYLVLYVDDILLIGDDVKMLGDIKA
ncbi:UNVERIFIED_CONTAM: Retrovirus-related Pol polyprotein from transposon TNT 1-94 [Sesamum latifolium]|uniref:Retrovirus-related Pol polyprotein from transposon TNT 1-94 n=1 Tax=Sesamum latifolium TaxID=2727402 RepID=A0AAW2WEU0_9LAMI